MKNFKEISVIVLAFIFIAVILFFISLSNSSPDNETSIFVVSSSATSTEEVAEKLNSESFISSKWIFETISSIAGINEVEPGGYSLKKGTNFFKIVNIFSNRPGFVWVTIPEGLRKEEIAEIVGNKLGWNEGDKTSFITAHTNDDYTEGVYFPDTYLIPHSQTGSEMAERMINKFNEKFQPYSEKFAEENIKWTTGLKIASLIQREALNEEEMPLISGIIWNRLLNGMRLQIDATIQYARGLDGYEKEAEDLQVGKSNWWTPMKKEDKEIDSPYNTYKYEGLPPTPIANPGIPAIEAALYPQETDCIYYLHSDYQIHCSSNYDDHLDNIERYLK
jgi:UPF0755 protein